MNKILTGAIGAAATLAATFGPVSPAQAATNIIQHRQCVDGSGNTWDAFAKWRGTYTDSAGVRRASIDQVYWTTEDLIEGAGTDSQVRTYSGGTLIQTLTQDGADIDYTNDVIADDGSITSGIEAGSEGQLRNPQNPRDLKGRSHIVLRLGEDGDGLGDCEVWFYEPNNLTAL
jgi:hypothetical protein